ncbi:MAG: hypothetical protein ACE5MG_06650 [Candidatus Methylomirabilales bacterium]
MARGAWQERHRGRVCGGEFELGAGVVRRRGRRRGHRHEPAGAGRGAYDLPQRTAEPAHPEEEIKTLDTMVDLPAREPVETPR